MHNARTIQVLAEYVTNTINTNLSNNALSSFTVISGMPTAVAVPNHAYIDIMNYTYSTAFITQTAEIRCILDPSYDQQKATKVVDSILVSFEETSIPIEGAITTLQIDKYDTIKDGTPIIVIIEIEIQTPITQMRRT